jgi:phosphate transport system substrate-binding protein
MLKFIKTAAVAATLLAASAAGAQTSVKGEGASFPAPLYQKWIAVYSAAKGLAIDYQPSGSGAGIKSISAKTVDFAGSDAPLNKKEKEGVQGEIVHIPTTAGAVVLAYNLPGFAGDLKLSGAVVADIYLGKVRKWNDPAIAALNAGAALPDLAVVPAWRSDGSGTTWVFTNYLSTQSPEFSNKVGASKAVKWPAGTGGDKNAGVAAAVKSLKGAVGYVELNFAEANMIPHALMRNADGKFVKATPDAVNKASVAAAGRMKPGALNVNIWNQPGADVYPIAAFSYVLVYKDLGYLKDPAKAKALVEFLSWAVADGQKYAAELTYAPLAPDAVSQIQAQLKQLTFDGQPVVK